MERQTSDVEVFGESPNEFIKRLLMTEANFVLEGMKRFQENQNDHKDINHIRQEVTNVEKSAELLQKDIERNNQDNKHTFERLKEDLILVHSSEVKQMTNILQDLEKTAGSLKEKMKSIKQDQHAMKAQMDKQASQNRGLTAKQKKMERIQQDAKKADITKLRNDIQQELKTLKKATDDFKKKFDAQTDDLNKRMARIEEGKAVINVKEAGFDPQGSNKMKFQELVECAARDVNDCKDLINNMKSELVSVKKFYEERSNAKYLQNQFYAEAESLRFHEFTSRNSSVVFRSLHQHFPNGVCYYKSKLSANNHSVYKILLCPLLKKNLIKRLPKGIFAVLKLNNPIEMRTAERVIKICEAYKIAPFGKDQDKFFVVPEIFGGYHALIGFDYMQKHEKELKISRQRIQEGDGGFFELFECA